MLVDAQDGASSHGQNIGTMLDSFRSHHKLAVDYDFQIMREYRRNLTPTSAVAQVLNRLMKTDRVSYWAGGVPPALEADLDAAHFDVDDRTFVGVGLSTPDRLLVAEESDYQEPGARAVLVAAGLNVVDCERACIVVATAAVGACDRR